ncbi:hypothetical protein BH23BAC1_BH23BAC1_44240 [soil metagenome]
MTIVLVAGCREQLDIINQNEPVEAEIRTEPGILSLGQSVFITGRSQTTEAIDNFAWVWFADVNHELAGDAMFVPWGNFSWRWVKPIYMDTIT